MKIIILITFCITMSYHCFAGENTKKKPNILFIAIDDLRPELGSYGSSIAVTPNIDAIASQGLLFNNAHAQQAICGPSRASLMTGTRPETNGVIHNYLHFRDKINDIVTIPQHFRENGYETAYFGKVFHGRSEIQNDAELSWSYPAAVNKLPKDIKPPVAFGSPENMKILGEMKKEMFAKYGEQAKYGLASGPAYEGADVPDTTFADGYNTELAITTMKEMLKDSDKPIFLGLGFIRPHLNWVSPKKYWDMYDRKDIKLSDQARGPTDGAAMGLHPSFELRVRHGIPNKGPINDELAVTLKHAYLACVSYVDAQIGRMLEALDDEGIRDNTIIIIWSDHGWHLGEMGIWGKATNYEIATRVPLILSTPHMQKENRGAKTDALVELVDIFPTLSELSGLSLPKQLEGQSLVPLLENPKRKWKKAVFSQFPTPALREWGSIPLRPGMRETYFGPLIEEVEKKIQIQQKEKWDRGLFENDLTGYAMRTSRYRIVAWKDSKAPHKEPLYIELYDHKKDPSESKNIAKKKPKLVSKLMAQLNAGWQKNTASISH